MQIVGTGFGGSFSEHLTKWAVPFAQPVFYAVPVRGGQDITVKNGTGTCLRLGDRYVGVTCYHVISAYRADRSAAGGGTFYFGKTMIDADSCVIGENKKADLVTLDLAAYVGPGCHLTEASFVHPVAWPPMPISGDDVVAFVGYPGVWRRRVSPTHFEFYHFSHGASSIESVAPDRFYSKFAIEGCVGSSQEGFQVGDVGGMSGGPVFAWRTGTILRAELVGFITEYQEAFDLLHIRRACCIANDGQLE